jgi:hypothetical protein
VVTKDALPFARTIGSRPARIFGVIPIGLQRRGFTPNYDHQLRHVYRYLMQSKLNYDARAGADRGRFDADRSGSPLHGGSSFRSSQRGVISAPRGPGAQRSSSRRRMKLGLLAGNGRFPFLVLDAARAQGHEVTIIAIKEETFLS